MNAFKEVKDWLLLKFQTLSTRQEDSVITRGINALTPRTIPEFVIPGSGNSSRRTSSECFGDMTLDFERKRNSYGGRQSSPPLSPRLSPSESMPCFHNAGRLSCSSAPVTPKHEVRNSIACKRGSSSTPGLNRMAHEDTNYDPLSIAAMSLPHFRGQTSFGFSTLTENPHTRRKESLFHAGSESLLTKRTNGKTIRQIKQFSKENISQDAHRLMAYHTKTNTQSPSVSMPSVIVTAAKQSTQTSPTDINMFPSQSSRRLSPTYHIYSNDGLSIANFNRFYNRRRSSLQIMTENEQEEFAHASEASTPSNDQQQRHSLGELHAQIVKASLKRHSAPNIPSEQKGRMEEIPKPRSSSCHVIRNDSYSQITQSTHLFAPHGELKFSFQYLPASKQLKVTIIKAENLGGQLKQDRQFNCFAKTYLMPGKLQKQISTIIKRTRDPMFDQEFYFQNITTEELHGMSLVIKLFSKATNFKPNEFIGKVSIPLDNYDVMNENRIWKDLELSKEREVCKM
ncbi:hypothetical protein DPMN_110634 [Dreissena polymorpha]|uniref:C2 domain-containing protein n=1 Tax=Dreissena polymorpha TaxID=45954 RepID=A0A9D4QN82_DREPO|nr:hypothetical protein DPMN_110634 [Dreissena polymorpha]